MSLTVAMLCAFAIPGLLCPAGMFSSSLSPSLFALFPDR
jgi:hypothetical protein